MDHEPHQPGEESLEVQRPDLRHRSVAADGRELALVEVFERLRLLAFDQPDDAFRRVAAALDRGRRKPGHARHRGEIADHEHFRRARQAQVRFDGDAPGLVERHAERRAERRGLHAGRPQNAARDDPLRPHRDALAVDAGDRPPEQHLHTHLLEPPLRRDREIGRKCRQHPRPRFDEHDPRRRRIDLAEVSRQHVPRDLGQRPRQLDAGRPRAHDHEREQRHAPRRIGLALGRFVREQDAAADLDRVLQRLEAGREARPLAVPEVRMRRAAGEDQIVVVDEAVAQHDPFSGGVDAHCLRQHHGDVLLPPQHAPQRDRDVRRAQRGRRHLVEQRLEQMMVAAVDERDPHVRTAQRTSRVEAAEAATDDHDVLKHRAG